MENLWKHMEIYIYNLWKIYGKHMEIYIYIIYGKSREMYETTM